jgi:hypothetical protein
MPRARLRGGSPGRGKVARQPPIAPALSTDRNAIRPKAAATKRRDFDPHALLATVGERRKEQAIFAQGDAADAVFISRRAR